MCQVFTPEELVKDMLDKAGYKTQLYGKKILENSCGDGAFLKEIVTRYIQDARSRNLSDSDIRNGLERDVYGIEKDGYYYQKCICSLNEIVREHGIEEVNWNIRQGDALGEKTENNFDFAVGNPPYITYYNLTQEERMQIRERFESCKSGKPDYYYAFTEAALRSLKAGGKLVYLIPDNFMKNRFSEDLRNYLIPHILELIDYRDQKIFKNYLTSSAILICQKDNGNLSFRYTDIPNKRESDIVKATLKGKWTFYLPEREENAVRFGDYFQVSAPVATLLNEAFVLNNVTEESSKYIFYNSRYLEKEIIRKAASPKTIQQENRKDGKKGKTYIIFPYTFVKGRRTGYKEEEFAQKFPQAYAYLEDFREKLLDRKADSKSQWFEYGRSQALDHINQEKIILSTLITDKVRYYRLDADTVPFSGMYIVPRAGHSLSEAENILSSRKFLEYIKEIGISVSGSSYRISPRDVAEYILS